MSFRRSYGVAAVVVLTLAGCAPRQTVHPQPPPCTESLDSRLEAEPPHRLSGGESIQMHDPERACVSTRATAEHGSPGGMMGMGGRSWWTMGVMMLTAAAMGLLMWH